MPGPPGELALAVLAEAKRLADHAQMCTGCSRCESMAAFTALEFLAGWHAEEHYCGVLRPALYGPGSRHGAVCFALAGAAELLGVQRPAPGGWVAPR